MDQTNIHREFVRHHFEAVNRRDVQTVLGNMRSDLYDHELEGDHKNDVQEGAQRLQVLMKQVPDLTVDVRDVIADGDKVVVRAVWFGTDAASQWKVEFHGFVQWRIVEGKRNKMNFPLHPAGHNGQQGTTKRRGPLHLKHKRPHRRRVPHAVRHRNHPGVDNMSDTVRIESESRGSTIVNSGPFGVRGN